MPIIEMWHTYNAVGPWETSICGCFLRYLNRNARHQHKDRSHRERVTFSDKRFHHGLSIQLAASHWRKQTPCRSRDCGSLWAWENPMNGTTPVFQGLIQNPLFLEQSHWHATFKRKRRTFLNSHHSDFRRFSILVFLLDELEVRNKAYWL